MPDRILSLDIATKLGWCFGVSGGHPTLGAVRLMGKGAEDGAIFASLCDWLADAITVHAPKRVVYEAPLVSGQHSSINAARLALGLVAVTQLVCWRREVRCEQAQVNRVRSKVIGSGRADKAAVAAWVASMGWKVPLDCGEPDLDACDAAAVWAYASGLWVQRSAA